MKSQDFAVHITLKYNGDDLESIEHVVADTIRDQIELAMEETDYTLDGIQEVMPDRELINVSIDSVNMGGIQCPLF